MLVKLEPPKSLHSLWVDVIIFYVLFEIRRCAVLESTIILPASEPILGALESFDNEQSANVSAYMKGQV